MITPEILQVFFLRPRSPKTPARRVSTPTAAEIIALTSRATTALNADKGDQIPQIM